MTADFVLCISSDGFELSLEPRKVYRIIPDSVAAGHALLRVIDETGEDYLYPESLFVPIAVPEEASAVFGAA